MASASQEHSVILRQALRHRDTPCAVIHEQRREPQRPVPSGDQGPRALPQRQRRTQVPVFGNPVARPHRTWPGTMDDAVETRDQRVLEHLRRPLPGSRDLLMGTAGNTVRAIDPLFSAAWAVAASEAEGSASDENGKADGDEGERIDDVSEALHGAEHGWLSGDVVPGGAPGSDEDEEHRDC